MTPNFLQDRPHPAWPIPLLVRIAPGRNGRFVLFPELCHIGPAVEPAEIILLEDHEAPDSPAESPKIDTVELKGWSRVVS